MKKILFVDDEPKILAGLKRMLFRMRKTWKITLAESGPQALEIMEKEHFDLIVSDMRMPGMDGAALLDEVKLRFPETVRFILSGQSEEETVMRSVKSAHQFLAKPCDTNKLVDSVNKVLALRELLNDERLKSLISRIETFPVLPDAYRALLAELETDDPSVKRVGRIMETDIGMTAKILQLVNSAFFGLGQPVADASQAAVLLGLETLKTLVLAVSIFTSVEKKDLPGSLSPEGLLRHSLAVGNFAKQIAEAENLDKNMISEAFTAGVLHDAGILLLAVNFRDDYQGILQATQENHSFITEAETKALGCTHAEIGAYILGIWGLPESIVYTVAHHHSPGKSPDEEFGPLAAVHIADALLSEIDPPVEDWDSAPIDHEFLGKIGVAEKLDHWRETCKQMDQREGLTS